MTHTLLGVGILVLITTAVLWAYQAPQRFAPALAVLRGTAQLAAISFILGHVIRVPLWVAAALTVMFCVAAATATRRVGWTGRKFALVGGAMAAGIAVSLTIVFVTGALALTSRYALAIGGIVIGNAMTFATLAGRRFLELVDDGWDHVEGWLALGATPRQATRTSARRALHAAMIPSTDQTKTTGLVTLPGAFVGAIFGGVSPLEAGRFQIVVLAAIMAAGSITAVVIIIGLAAVRHRPRTSD